MRTVLESKEMVQRNLAAPRKPWCAPKLVLVMDLKETQTGSSSGADTLTYS